VVDLLITTALHKQARRSRHTHTHIQFENGVGCFLFSTACLYDGPKLLHTAVSDVLHTAVSDVLHTAASDVLHTAASDVLHTAVSDVLHTAASDVLPRHIHTNVTFE
jgi:hypothetical protein